MIFALLLIAQAETSTATATATSSTSADVLLLDDEELLEELEAPKTAAAEPAAEPQLVDEIDVVAVRVAEAAKPDTRVRITGAELAERGVTNLAQALDQIADTPIRSAGRGGMQTDIRGARKGGVLILLDGIPIADPYLGNFDVSSIPATDIAEIRVALTPASPIDGPGGNGGVIEILTRAASGKTSARLQAQASDAPGGSFAATGKTTLGDAISIRTSGQVALGQREYVFTGGEQPQTGTEDLRGGNAGLRLERNFGGSTRFAADFGFARRAFVAPPTDQSDNGGGAFDVMYIRREDMLRGVITTEHVAGSLVFSARAFSLYLDRRGQRFHDLARSELYREEDVIAHRSGGVVQLDYALLPELRLTGVTHLFVEGGRQEAHNLDDNGVAILPTSDGGVAPILEPALGASWAILPWMSLELGAGVAAPIGVDGASPWPEGKLTLAMKPVDGVQVALTGSRKGRLPALRDRFDTLSGNPAVDPEQSTAVEGEIIWKPAPQFTLNVSGYYRLIEGLIRLGFVGTQYLSTNIGDALVTGFEARAETKFGKIFSAGAGYQFAHQAYAGGQMRGGNGSSVPLDFFPAHRAELFASVRPTAELGFWSRARYTGEREDKGNILDGFISVDASAWYQLEAVRLNVRAENLFYTSYELRTGVPGFGRTLWLGLEGNFE